MSIAMCNSCGTYIDTDVDPDSTDFIEDKFVCAACRSRVSDQKVGPTPWRIVDRDWWLDCPYSYSLNWISTGPAEMDCVAVVSGYEDRDTSREDLILTAINACRTLNPKDPQRAAEGIVGAVEALMEARKDIIKITEGAADLLHLHGYPCDPAEKTYGPAVGRIDAILSTIRGEEG